jgi:hypothetical protein
MAWPSSAVVFQCKRERRLGPSDLVPIIGKAISDGASAPYALVVGSFVLVSPLAETN